MKIDFKALREQSGLTLEELAEKVDYAVATLNGLELHDEGSQRLRDAVLEIIGKDKGQPPARLADAAMSRDLEEWKRRAMVAEGRMTELVDGILELLKRVTVPAKTPRTTAAPPTGPTVTKTAGQIAAEALEKKQKGTSGPGFD